MKRLFIAVVLSVGGVVLSPNTSFSDVNVGWCTDSNGRSYVCLASSSNSTKGGSDDDGGIGSTDRVTSPFTYTQVENKVVKEKDWEEFFAGLDEFEDPIRSDCSGAYTTDTNDGVRLVQVTNNETLVTYLDLHCYGSQSSTDPILSTPDIAGAQRSAVAQISSPDIGIKINGHKVASGRESSVLITMPLEFSTSSDTGSVDVSIDDGICSIDATISPSTNNWVVDADRPVYVPTATDSSSYEFDGYGKMGEYRVQLVQDWGGIYTMNCFDPLTGERDASNGLRGNFGTRPFASRVQTIRVNEAHSVLH